MARTGGLLALLLMSICASASQVSPQQLTSQGYQLLTDPQVTGGHLVATRQGSGSATALLAQALQEVAGFFGGRPEVVAAACDNGDQWAEALFRATVGRAAVGGIAYAIVGGGKGTTGFVYDSPQAIRQSFPRLVQLAGVGGGPTPAPALNWREVPFPDGSGWMKLPEGWVITFANKGMAAAQGPHGVIERGVWTQAYTRAAMAQMMSRFPSMVVPTLVADPTDPVTVLREYTAHVNTFSRQQGMAPRDFLRLVEGAEVPPGPGYAQAAFLDWEYEMSGVRYRSIQYLMLGTINMDGSWILYTTYVASRSDSFAQNLPVLLEIWASARTAQHVIHERLDAAMRSLREAGEIYRQTAENRARSQQRIHDKWTEVFRGTRIVEDTLTGERRDVQLGWSTEIVRRLNEGEGYPRYREIPLHLLNQ